jgi:tuftelin-interacting protein 11
LENIEVMVHGNVDTNTLQEVSVAAIHPLFRTSMLEWEPLGDPSYLTPYLGRLKRLLGMDEESDSSINGLSYQSTRRTKSTTHYETMIYTLWLPVVRGAITNSWDVYNPTPLTALLTAWRPLLPAFVYSNVIEQLLVPRLTTALDSWRPSRSRKSRHYSPPPNEWLFDFLPFLPKSQTDPLLSSGLVTDLKRKIRKLLSNHDLSSPPPDYLNPFAPLLGSTLTTILTNTLLPRLRVHLDTTFIIDPADQDIAPFTHLLTYLSLFSPSTFAELLAQTFFPQFHQVLHLWLTSSFEHAEIMEWFMWWQSQFPESLRNLPVLEEQWNRALETINMALDLGDRAAAELPPPEAASSLQSSPALPTPAPAQQPPTSHELLPEPTMREVVEDWCADVGILLIPLHEAHRETGAPIFRLTASASGKGGVKVYIRGFLVYAQDKKEREKWEPVELDDTLVERAGG